MIYKCSICGNQENNSLFVAREMMFGMRHKFPYFKCAECGCLQIVEIPKNMEVYYPDNYYSYNTQETDFRSIKSKIADYLLFQSWRCQAGQFNLIGLFARFYNPDYYFANKKLNAKSRVLDVGCGYGARLLSMKKAGFKNLVGVDPYIKADLRYDNGVTIYKNTIFEIEGAYDFIMLHHSFEHLSDPHETIARLSSLLAENGTLLIRIPIVDSYAWRKYGIDWFQLDAPRHFYLHTVKSISYLAQKHNLKLDRVLYDSSECQFTTSENYRRDIPLYENGPLFSSKEKAMFKRMKDQLNKSGDADQACFYLSKKQNQIIKQNKS